MREQDPKLLLAYYGDDFTGSTDSMEALVMNGVHTMLFLEPPTPERLAMFPGLRAFGVAGVSRSYSPQEMEEKLRPLFEELADLPAPIIHYKMCSTFDSSPTVGSIGKAIELGRDIFIGARYVPLLVGAPQLRRYTVFGQHFAGNRECTYRLDRHPTMSRHPVTPMDEADLRLHLAKQTFLSVGLMDVLDLTGSSTSVRERLEHKLAFERPDIMLYDVLDEERLHRAGERIWEEAKSGRCFVVGSSGVEYALAAVWQSEGTVLAEPMLPPRPGRAGPLLAVSGSCSPVTSEQIEAALSAGFVGVQAPTLALIQPDLVESALARLHREVKTLLSAGRDVIVYSARGPEDESIRDVQSSLRAEGISESETSRRLGRAFGRLTRTLILDCGLKRVLVAGGDTSGYVCQELGVQALELLIPIAPGGPLCQAHSDDSRFDGIELALKGGQVGQADYFIKVKEGNQ